jgi:hypothetical protein
MYILFPLDCRIPQSNILTDCQVLWQADAFFVTVLQNIIQNMYFLIFKQKAPLQFSGEACFEGIFLPSRRDGKFNLCAVIV